MSDDRAPSVFLSYRREDERYAAVVREGLGGCGFRVLQDLHDLRLGGLWTEQLRTLLRTANLTLALIGPGWLARMRDLAREDDPVRQEIQRAVSVLPVLVGGASMPARDRLPAPVRSFHLQQAATIEPGREAEGIRSLCEELRGVLARRAEREAEETAELEELERQAREEPAPAAAPPPEAPPGPRPILISVPRTGRWESTIRHPDGSQATLVFDMNERGDLSGTYTGPPRGLLRRRAARPFVGRMLMKVLYGAPVGMLIEGYVDGRDPIRFEILHDLDHQLGEHFETRLPDGSRILSRVLEDFGQTRI